MRRMLLRLALAAALCALGTAQSTVIAAWSMSTSTAATSGAEQGSSTAACCGQATSCPPPTGTSCAASPCCYYNALGWLPANGWNSATNGNLYQYLQVCTTTAAYAAPITLSVSAQNLNALVGPLQVYVVASSATAMTSLAPAGAVTFSPTMQGT